MSEDKLQTSKVKRSSRLFAEEVRREEAAR